MSRAAKIFSIFVVVVVMLTVGGYFYIGGFKNAVDPENTEPIEFTIDEGATAGEIGKNLKRQGLIRNDMYFKYTAKKNNLTDFKYGTYELKKSDDLITIIKKLNEGGRPLGEKFTVIEGMKIYDIAMQFENAGIMNKDHFIDATSDKKRFEDEFTFLKSVPDGSLEGYLYPETYFIQNGASVDDIIRLFLEHTQKIFDENHILTAFNGLSPKIANMNDFVTLASIVQRESGKVDDMQKIAGVFLKRLDKDMPLQSCATIEYITGMKKQRISYEDTQLETPYNTYKYTGLPPTPICSPSLEAMNAVLNYDKNDYMFFVSDPDGNTYFSKTYDEHLETTKRIYGEY